MSSTVGGSVKMDKGSEASAGVACAAIGCLAVVTFIVVGVWTAVDCTVTGS